MIQIGYGFAGIFPMIERESMKVFPMPLTGCLEILGAISKNVELQSPNRA